MKYLIFACLLFAGCSKGPHVSMKTMYMSKYVCYYSDSVWKADRVLAMCETEQECNEVCKNHEGK